MKLPRLFLLALFAGAGILAPSLARAQTTPTPPPQAAATPTAIDRAYDGQLHVTIAPYVWLPTISQSLQYTIPTLRTTTPVTTQTNVSIGPSSYLAKINAAAMFAIDARQGVWDFYADYVYTNVSSSSSFNTTLTGPRGKIVIPVTFNTSSRLASSIWELAPGISLYHSHYSDLTWFFGYRDFPATLTLGYNALVGKRGLIAPSGTVGANTGLTDFIFGVRGKALLGDGHWYVPYYIDYGTGNNQSWLGYTGAGYLFDHGQSLLLVYKSLNYSAFAPNSPIQNLSMSGPAFAYTFGL